jgi:hypothetical protein
MDVFKSYVVEIERNKNVGVIRIVFKIKSVFEFRNVFIQLKKNYFCFVNPIFNFGVCDVEDAQELSILKIKGCRTSKKSELIKN